MIEQTIIAGVIVALAAFYVVLRLRRALQKPACRCDDPSACPYAKRPPDGKSCPR